MKIMTKVLLTILIVCFAVIISVVPCFALPSSSDSGSFANNGFLVSPRVLTVDLVNGQSVSFPLAYGTGTDNASTLSVANQLYAIGLTSYASSLQFYARYIDNSYFASSFSVSFDPLFINLSDFSRVFSNVGLSYLSSATFSGYCIDSSDGRKIDVYFEFHYNTSSSYTLSSAVFNNPVSPSSTVVVTDWFPQYFSSLGYDKVFLEEVILIGTPTLAFNSGGTASIWFNSPYRADYYETFEFTSTITDVVYEDIDLVGWIYDVIDGLFGTVIFGDITLGNLFIIVLAVPMLVAVFKAIAGG